MLESAAELSKLRWPEGYSLWTRQDTGEHGVVARVSLPTDQDLARMLCSLWKKEMRFWWAAWTDGIRVLEPRSWWTSRNDFYVWMVSSSSTPVRVVESEEVRESEEVKQIVSNLHSRKLGHGSLDKPRFFQGSQGYEIAPPLDISTISMSVGERIHADEEFFDDDLIKSSLVKSGKAIGNEIFHTLTSEAVAFYEMTYFCKVEHKQISGFPQKSIVLRLFKDEPHPTMGALKRENASSFFLSMLRQMEGEQFALLLSNSANPFQTKGVTVPVLGDVKEDEDCLVILPDASKKFSFEEGWCRPSDPGTLDLIRRKKDTLSRAADRLHIIRWTKPKEQSRTTIPDRKMLPEAILRNEVVFCVQGPPGTGKTHLACDVVGQLLDEDKDARILVCAKEHQALRILRQKLLTRFQDKIESHVLVSFPRHGQRDNSQEGSSYEFAKQLVSREPPDYSPSSWKKSVSQWNGQPPPILERFLEGSAQIVFATTTSWPMNIRRLSPVFEPFDFVVVEEAGKCYPSEIFPALALARNAFLIGDQNQLPPFELEATQAAADYLHELKRHKKKEVDEIFEELVAGLDPKEIDWQKMKSWLQPFATLYESRSSFTLSDEYRMIPLISEMIGETFYSTNFTNKRSSADSEPIFHHPILKDLQLVWIDVPYCSDYPKAREDLTGHRFNRFEIACVSKLLTDLKFVGNKEAPDIAILSPYNAQVDRLAGNKGLTAALPEVLENVPMFNPRDHVRTVDSFQGNEADLVIISLVRNNTFGNPHNAWGFILNRERLNVMFSRARRHLVVIGCSQMVDLYSTYDQVKPLSQVLNYFRQHGQVVPALTKLGVMV